MAGNEQKSGRELRVALAGNPNAGKTTVFNGLTGNRQTVGNYPGVTVERIEGTFTHRGHRVRVVDLPGTYSLAALSQDELVARDFILEEPPDVVVSIVDASNLERNLYLTTQFMELKVPLIVVLNKSDLAEALGLDIDLKVLSRLLGAPVVETIGHEAVGLDALKDQVVETATGAAVTPAAPRYGREIEAEISSLMPLAEKVGSLRHRDPRWLALKLLEGDEVVLDRTAGRGDEAQELIEQARQSVQRIEKHFGDRAEIVIADQRYGFISGACQEAVRTTVEARHSLSDRIDTFVTSRLFGIPIFLLLMYLLFKVTFTFGAPPMAWIEQAFGWLSGFVTSHWPGESLLESLVVDGVIGGVGGVLVFLPNIVILFAAIAFLEDSGYMARGAFIVDRFMHKLGLHGRSFIPAMVGFGCTVPAILATRALENRRDRLTTMLVLPLVSCGARFPIYTLFVAAFFPASWRARVLFSLYLVGIVLAALLARLLRSTLFRGEMSMFVMELPPYRLPTARGILGHTWERTRLFLRKAATVIVVASVILWSLTNFPRPAAEALADKTPAEQQAAVLSTSIAGRIGQGLEPVMRHVGFDWRTTTALIGAFAAKEIFVAQLGIVYALGETGEGTTSLGERLREAYNPLQAYCIMLFCLISVPCMATLAVTRAESGRWLWALVQLFGLTLLAYGVTFVVFQVGSLLGIGT